MRAPAQRQHRAIGPYRLQAQDVIPRHAILETARAAGVGGHSAANTAISAAGRIGGIIQPFLLRCILERFQNHARLHHGHKITRIDFLDPVHALQ